MPIGLGLASSHAPGMYVPRDSLKVGVEQLASRWVERGAAIPPAYARMTTNDLLDHWDRFRAGHAALKDQIAKYDPEALVFIGGDQSEMFDSSNKANLMVYTGAESYGWKSPDLMRRVASEQNKITYKTHVEMARWLHQELVETEGFDAAFSEEMAPLGKPTGLPHPFTNINEMFPRADLPVIMIYLNTYDPPAFITAERCYQLGQAIARIFAKESRRVAIYGSGGLWHDLGGPMTLWVDEQMDRWFLDQIKRGNGKALQNMYSFDSLAVRSGTGENRAWIGVTGAMEEVGSQATIVDYFPAPETITGIGFAYWTPNKKS
ncbi:MAG: hypothetical protein EXR59_03820 [Dehalococcoidia bacterium]|nr:hypothetical protein [Dehalococcoidia bacterium]